MVIVSLNIEKNLKMANEKGSFRKRNIVKSFDNKYKIFHVIYIVLGTMFP